MAKKLLTELATFRNYPDEINVVIETPKGSRNKYIYDPEEDVFELSGVMPEGSTFPHDFGFVPGTTGGDGDPLDVLVLMDAPGEMGCVTPARLIGVIEAEQTENGKTERNDRLLAVASPSREFNSVKSLADLRPGMMDEIEHYFVSYNQMKGKEFKPIRRGDPAEARKIVEQGQRVAGKSK